MDEGRLAEFLTSQAGSPVEVRDSRLRDSTYSRLSYAVDTSAGPLVVRVEQGVAPAGSSGEELRLMQSLRKAGYPVANARWSEPTGDVLGRPFIVIDDPGVEPVDEQSVNEAAATAFVKAIATLHRLDLSHLPAADPDQAIHAQIERWRGVGKSVGGPRVPVLDAIEIWLHQNAPLDKKVAIVHGAPRPGNLLIADGELVALTDWEVAHVGDPAEDWSYNMAIRNVPAASRQLWLGLFEREAGMRLSKAQWAYWDAFNMYKEACINRARLALFESGADHSPAQAIAGTAEYHGLLRRLLNIVE